MTHLGLLTYGVGTSHRLSHTKVTHIPPKIMSPNLKFTNVGIYAEMLSFSSAFPNKDGF